MQRIIALVRLERKSCSPNKTYAVNIREGDGGIKERTELQTKRFVAPPPSASPSTSRHHSFARRPDESGPAAL